MERGKLILDTNIVSYLWKNHPISQFYWKDLHGKLLFISFITVGELFYWAETAGWGEKRRTLLEKKIREFIVVPYDYQMARAYAKIAAERKRVGAPISLHDAWIAATAVRHKVPLVTHNAKDFEQISELELISRTFQQR